MRLGGAMAELRARLRQWWEQRNERERWLIALGGGLLAVVVPYVAFWEPLVERTATLEAEVAEQREDLAWMRRAAREIEAQRGEDEGAGEPITDDRSLLSVVDRSARRSGLEDALSRVQPEDGDTVRVWMDDAPFDDLVSWLDALQRTSGVRVDSMSVERTRQDGIVDARLTLEVGA